MMPNTQTSISLDQLNQYIAEQRGISVNDLALGNQTSVKDIASVNNITPSTLEKETATQDVAEQTTSSEPLSDADLAKKYRSDADRLSKEAAALRRMAEEIAPTKKKTTTVE
jgi:3-deoxy-D-arabino-heptulosonate 7-phosphate (DAHP) synthase class II